MIFVNNEFGFWYIEVYGFDYDYILVFYFNIFYYFIYDLVVKELIFIYGVGIIILCF